MFENLISKFWAAKFIHIVRLETDLHRRGEVGETGAIVDARGKLMHLK